MAQAVVRDPEIMHGTPVFCDLALELEEAKNLLLSRA
jgi:hypothetical protein